MIDVDPELAKRLRKQAGRVVAVLEPVGDRRRSTFRVADLQRIPTAVEGTADDLLTMMIASISG